MNRKRVAIDLDNTVVCYDASFLRLLHERGYGAPEMTADKTRIRGHLCALGHQEVWTELQGEAYGPRMPEAEPFPGVEEFFRSAIAAGVEILIVSHRSLTPYSGLDYDLHSAARAWIKAHDAIDAPLYLETTLAAKIERIVALDCTHIIDDMPAVLTDPALPAAIERIHFDPHHSSRTTPPIIRVEDWAQARSLVL